MPEDLLPAAVTKAFARLRHRALVRELGPGLVSGAADTDPSGIGTYSQAGVQLGHPAGLLVLLCYPLMIVTQEISARIGCATEGGLVSALRARYPNWLVAAIVGAVAVANTINIGADLGAMGDALRLLFGGPPLLYMALCAGLCVAMLLMLRLPRYVLVVKWAALSLLGYVVAALGAMTSWDQLTAGILAPRFDGGSVPILVAVVGTSISPYLFVWQSSLEGERARGLSRFHRRETASIAGAEMRRIRFDTWAGMTVAVLLAYAIAATAASSLHGSGITEIETSSQAAEALRNVAGPLTEAVFCLGVLSTGFLAVPMLAGSAAFAVGEGFGWPVGLALLPKEAAGFHGCILVGTLAGLGMDLFGINPIRALIWSAIVNGLMCAPVLVAMMLIARRRDVMGPFALSVPLAALGWLTALVMASAGLGLILTSL